MRIRGKGRFCLFPLRIYTALKPHIWIAGGLSVCFPYEFTLLSNTINGRINSISVCFPYEFTLLSNLGYRFLQIWSLFPLRIYTALKQSPCWPPRPASLFPLRIYTALKPPYPWLRSRSVCFPYEFTLLSNVDRDIRQAYQVCFPYEFTLLSNVYPNNLSSLWFVSPTNLHCSQTSNLKLSKNNILQNTSIHS